MNSLSREVTMETKKQTNTNNKFHWLEITEYVCMAGSVAATVSSFVIETAAIYVAPPITATLFLGAVNRTRLQKQQQQERQEAIAQLYQVVGTVPEPIMKQLGVVEDKLAAQNEEQTQKLEAAIAPLAADLQALMPVLGRVDALSQRLMGAETLVQSLKERTQSQIDELTEKLVRVKAEAQSLEQKSDREVQQLTEVLSQQESFAQNLKAETEQENQKLTEVLSQQESFAQNLKAETERENQKLTQKLSQQESFAQGLKAETQAEEGKLKEAIAELQQELETLEPVKAQIQELEQQQPQTLEAIAQLKDRTTVIGLIEQDITKINGEIEELAYQLDNIPEAAEPDLSKIEAAIASLQKRLKLHPVQYRSSLFKGQDLSNAYLHQAQLGYANLKGVNLNGSDLTGANLKGVKLSGASLIKALLTDANLINAKLGGSELQEVDLSYANLKGADLRKVDLTSANLNAIDLSAANLKGANLASANVADGDLTNANLQNANLSNANLSGAVLANADLSDADLSNANLSFVDLTNANLRNANLRGANLWNTNLTNANLAGAIVDATTKIDDRSPLKSLLQPVTEEDDFQAIALGDLHAISLPNTKSNDVVVVRTTD